MKNYYRSEENGGYTYKEARALLLDAMIKSNLDKETRELNLEISIDVNQYGYQSAASILSSQVQREIVDLKSDIIAAALIELGWTPPEEDT